MEVNEILAGIQHNNGRFAREAVLAAIEKREEITPHLLRILEQTIESAEELAEDPCYMAHLYALHLLAQFREKRAYPLTAQLFSIPGEIVDELTGDFLTEGLGLVLASVANGDSSLIKKLVENREAFVWARVGALRAIPAMVGAQELSREGALAYFQDLLRGKLEREPFERVVDVWGALVGFAIDLYPEEIYEDIRKAYDHELINAGFVSLKDVDKMLGRGKEEVLQALPKKHPLITDTIEEMQWWACFKDDYKERQAQQEKRWSRDIARLTRQTENIPGTTPSTFRNFSRSGSVDHQNYPATQTILRDTPKLGRNAPCSCGSGKKYKKCCGIKERA